MNQGLSGQYSFLGYENLVHLVIAMRIWKDGFVEDGDVPVGTWYTYMWWNKPGYQERGLQGRLTRVSRHLLATLSSTVRRVMLQKYGLLPFIFKNGDSRSWVFGRQGWPLVCCHWLGLHSLKGVLSTDLGRSELGCTAGGERLAWEWSHQGSSLSLALPEPSLTLPPAPSPPSHPWKNLSPKLVPVIPKRLRINDFKQPFLSKHETP